MEIKMCLTLDCIMIKQLLVLNTNYRQGVDLFDDYSQSFPGCVVSKEHINFLITTLLNLTQITLYYNGRLISC